MNIGKKIISLRELKNISRKELAIILDMNYQTLSNYENNKRTPDPEILIKLAQHFNVTTDYLLDITDNNIDLTTAKPQGKLFKIPVLGTIRAGEPILAEENIIDYQYADKSLVPTGELFYLQVKGDSMNLSGIIEGSRILVRKQDMVENGQTAVILVNGNEATVKKVYVENNLINLVPNSSNLIHQQKVIDMKIENVKIIGKVVGTWTLQNA